MKIKIKKTISSDKLILVSGERLMQCENDLTHRESDIILNAYHKGWFFDNFAYFTPPAAEIINGKIIFINGRHRTILLAQHLALFPFLIGNIDRDNRGNKPKASSLKILDNIKICDIEEHSIFILPDLKFGNFKLE
jgi:hypothetical protein